MLEVLTRGTVHVLPHSWFAELDLEADKTMVICGESVQMGWTRLGSGRETGRTPQRQIAQPLEGLGRQLV